MPDAGTDPLVAAAAAYVAACRDCTEATQAADAAYQRFQANPHVLEYTIDWTEARKREAAAVFRKRTAAIAYRLAGGQPVFDGDERFFDRLE